MIKKNLSERPLTKKILKNSAWITLERIAEILSTVFVGLYVAKELGPDRYGTLIYASAYCALFSFLGTFGMDPIMVKEIAKKPENKDLLLGSAFTIVLIGRITMVMIIGLTAVLAGFPHERLILILIFGGSFLLHLHHPIHFYFQSTLKSKYSTIARIISLLVGSGGRLFLISIEAHLYWFASVAIVSSLIRLGAYVVMYWMIGESLRHWRSSMKVVKGILSESWPLSLNSVALGLYTQIDKIMIGSMAGMKVLGIYQVALRIMILATYCTKPFVVSTTPMLVRAFERSKQEYWDKLRKVSGLFAWCGFWFSLIICVCGNLVATWILGSDFDAGALLYGILSLRILVSFPGLHNSTYLILSRNAKIHLLIQTIGACINILLNALLIPRFGLEGAAFATAFTCMVSFYGIHYLIVRSFPLVSAYHRAWKSAFRHEFLRDFFKPKPKKAEASQSELTA